jgi:hypothetical protein
MEYIKLDWEDWNTEEEDNKEKKILIEYKNNDDKVYPVLGVNLVMSPVSIVFPSLRPLNL